MNTITTVQNIQLEERDTVPKIPTITKRDLEELNTCHTKNIQ